MRKAAKRVRALLVLAVAASLAIGVNGPAAEQAAADPVRPKGPATQQTTPVRGRPFVPAPQAEGVTTGTQGPVRSPRWPAASTSVVSVTAQAPSVLRRAGSSPIWIGPVRGAVQPSAVTLRVLGQDESQRLGVAGLAFAVTDSTPMRAAVAATRVRIRVSYADFTFAYGGDWASRLRLVRLSCLPKGCAPGAAATNATNNLKARVLEGDVDIQPGTAGSQTLFAVTAGPSGANGSYEATTLAPSSTWQVSNQTGDFTWNYPLRVPPGLAGPRPELAIQYGSGSVDGKTASTNNQASWVGEGHGLEPGFVERKYIPCRDDMSGGNNSTKTGDLCWKTESGTIADHVVLSLGGKSTEVLKVAENPEKWRLREDDGSRIERQTGAANGASGGEHWILTTSDGTKYFFGLSPVAYGGVRTNSVSTVPVFGNHADEPCHAATFATSYCQQAWRWGLDRVIDTSGNVMHYKYQQEDNYYGRNNNNGVSEYQRASYLLSIEYGIRSAEDTTTVPPAWVRFGTYERCTQSQAICEGPLNASTAPHWPDVPFDQICTSSASCPSKTSPAFFTRKRLTSVSTNIWVGAVRTVDTWSLTQSLEDPGDGTARALWLQAITHKGGGGTNYPDPSVNFTFIQMDNRVDNLTDGAAEMKKLRIARISTDTGLAIDVSYLPKHCSTTTKPAHPANNGYRCMPVYWTKPLDDTQRLDWFHKYPVSVVHEDDLVTDAPIKTTTYEYVGTTAWHYDDNDLALPKYRTWGDWRGYQTVNVKVGVSGGQTQTRYLYFRGMHGDRDASGGQKSVTVTDSTGLQYSDLDRAHGHVLEQITYNGAGGAEVAGTINTPWVSGSTGSDGRHSATMLGTKQTRTRTRLSDGSNRVTGTNTEFDGLGMPIEVDDHGDVTTFADDRCKRISYARNPNLWITATVNREETVAVRCAATPNRATDLVSDILTYHDGQTDLTSPPTRPLPTKVVAAVEWTTGPVYKQRGRTTHDAAGRVTATYDGLDRRISTTSYTPPLSAPVTGVATTDGKGFAKTQTLDPAWGLPTSSVDANNRRTDTAYDAVGRLISVWLPDRSKAGGQSPSMRFGYKLSKSVPSVVTTQTLLPNGAYRTSKTLYDGFLRKRQMQTPTATGVGRMVTDTRHNNRGSVFAVTTPYYDVSTNGANDILYDIYEVDIPAETVYTYDGADRQTVASFELRNVEAWRTTTTYGGSWVATSPPTGGTPTATILDARGRTSELRQYNGPVLGPTYNSTRYTYTERDELATVTDARGSVWRYDYDLVGRKLSSVDPDKGTSMSTYDDADRLITSRDARGVVLHYSYDELSRKTAVREGSATGPLRASWLYDTLVKGQPTSSTRHIGGNAYVSAVTGYDAAYRPTGTSVTIPAVEGKLAGTYTDATTYLADGSVNTHKLANVPGQPIETLEYFYNPQGLVEAMGGYGAYVAGTVYAPNGKPVQYDLGPTIGKAAWKTFTYEPGTERLATWKVNRENIGGEEVFAYTYDPAGNVKSLTQTGYGAVDRQCFTTDFLRRMSEAWTPSGPACTTGPSVTELGGPVPYWHSYRHSPAGDRTTQIDHKSTGDITSTYTYPAATAPRPHAVTSVATGLSTNTYGYDATGNLSSRTEGGATDTLTWDDEGHLEKVSGPSGATSFVYDASGARLIRHDPQGATLYVGSAEVRWDQATDTVSSTRYYQHQGQSIIMRTGLNQAEILFTDHHNTAQINVDAYTAEYSRRRYDAFGNLRQQGGPWQPTTHGFVNGVIDASTRLTHLGAREYDPKLGRFISVDPLIDTNDPQTLNAYAYGNNNPTTFADPAGLCPMADEGGCWRPPTPPSRPNPPPDHEGQVGNTRGDSDVSQQVSQQVGVTTVIAPDADTYYRALQAARLKMEQRRRGWDWRTKPIGFENCRSQDTMLPGWGSCGGALAIYATQFGKAMCEAPGMICGTPRRSGFGEVLAMAGSVGMFGGGRDGSVASGGKFFHNRDRHNLDADLRIGQERGVTPARPGSAEFDSAVAEGRVKWAVLEDGSLVIQPRLVGGEEIPHTVLTQGRPVRAAGEAEVSGSSKTGYFGIEITNHSGHYQPSAASLQVGRNAFAEAGIHFR